jgi:sphinganine C4-monooxygenase
MYWPVLLLAAMPALAYAAVCALIQAFGRECKEPRSSVTKRAVLTRVATLLVLNTAALLLDFHVVRASQVGPLRPFSVPLGLVLMDTAEYWAHRLLHLPWFYALAHKEHHQLVVPWSFGALYNGYWEVALAAPVIASAFALCGFTWIEFVVVQTLAYVATVVQHWAPSNPHLLHHNGHPDKNFQQPFFFYWDRLLGTYHEESCFYSA